MTRFLLFAGCGCSLSSRLIYSRLAKPSDKILLLAAGRKTLASAPVAELSNLQGAEVYSGLCCNFIISGWLHAGPIIERCPLAFCLIEVTIAMFRLSC
jgi:hypothetical protein